MSFYTIVSFNKNSKFLWFKSFTKLTAELCPLVKKSIFTFSIRQLNCDGKFFIIEKLIVYFCIWRYVEDGAQRKFVSVNIKIRYGVVNAVGKLLTVKLKRVMIPFKL